MKWIELHYAPNGGIEVSDEEYEKYRILKEKTQHTGNPVFYSGEEKVFMLITKNVLLH